MNIRNILKELDYSSNSSTLCGIYREIHRYFSVNVHFALHKGIRLTELTLLARIQDALHPWLIECSKEQGRIEDEP